jgi:hypothetical protein
VGLFVVFLLALGLGTAALARARLRRRLGIISYRAQRGRLGH